MPLTLPRKTIKACGAGILIVELAASAIFPLKLRRPRSCIAKLPLTFNWLAKSAVPVPAERNVPPATLSAAKPSEPWKELPTPT